MPQSNRFGFIITKPLQLMVVLAMLEQIDKDAEKEFILVDSFFGAQDVSLMLVKHQDFMGRVRFFKTHDLAYGYAENAGYDKIFIDSDVGVRKFFQLLKFKLKNFKSKIAVYEEGLGTYRADLYPGISNFIKFFGVGARFGGCIFSSEIFLFHRQKYIDKFGSGKIIVNEIEKKIQSTIWEQLDFLNNIFGFSMDFLPENNQSHGKVCNIYLTDWDYDEVAFAKFSSVSGMKIVKAHPHMKSVEFQQRSDIFIVPPGVPAEVLIANLIGEFSEVLVFHHGSSAVRYVNHQSLFFLRV